MRQLTNKEAKAWFESAVQYCQNDFIDQYGHPRNVPGQVALDVGFKNGFLAGLEYSAESLDCLRLVQQLAGGQDWREWLERATNALIIVNNQYGNVESAMAEHSGLFEKPESGNDVRNRF